MIRKIDDALDSPNPTRYPVNKKNKIMAFLNENKYKMLYLKYKKIRKPLNNQFSLILDQGIKIL
jgi:hypothetical protein